MPSVQPRLSCSQNFLRDPRLVALLVDRSSISAGDLVYEIGAGRGIITGQLAGRCRQVMAIEKDALLAGSLRRRFAPQPHVTILEGDFLACPLPREPYKVFANIPFGITAAVVERLTGERAAPDDAYLVMQREAAETLLGEPRGSLRATLLQPWFEGEVAHHFRRDDFAPPPHVDVVMLRLRKRGPPLVDAAHRQSFRDFVTYVYTAWQPSVSATLRDLFSGPQLRRIRRELAGGRGGAVHGDDTGLDGGGPTALSFELWMALWQRFERLANETARERVRGSEHRLAGQQARLQKVHRTRASAPKAAWRGQAARRT